MINPIAWIKANKLATILLLAVLFLVVSRMSSMQSFGMSQSSRNSAGSTGMMESYDSDMKMAGSVAPSSMGLTREFNPVAPAPDVANRMVVTNSSLSLLVSDVAAGIEGVKSYVTSVGGYMVNSNINRPEEGGTGTITVRIPSDKLDEALSHLKIQAVKVVSENMDGYDVTDQFVDNEARLVILERNKARFEEIMTSATTVAEIVRVQEEIFNLQSRIDSIKGQQKYLEETSKTSLVTLFLSTDELALPYAPQDTWRPAVVFKLAVRSLLTFAQSLGSFVIWLGVYAVIWLPILLIALFLMKRRPPRPLS